MTNSFKGLYLIDRVPELLWTEVHDIVQEALIKIIPKKKKCKKAKWLSEDAFKISEKRREVKGKGEKERYTHLNADFQRIASRDKKAFLSDQCKEIEEHNRMGKTRDLFKKIRDTRRIFLNSLYLWAISYTVEVINRFKGLDLIDRVPAELWTEVHNIVQEVVIKTIPKKNKCKKAN